MLSTEAQLLAHAVALGLDHFSAGRLQHAEAAFREILQRQPRHAEALHGLGLVAFRVGRHEPACALIEQALAVDAGNAMYLNNLGTVQLALGRNDAAAGCFQRAVSLQPDYPDALYNLGNTLMAQGRHAEAIGRYQHLLSVKPDYAEAHYNLGNAFQDLGFVDEAIACYRRAISLRPALVAAQSNLLLTLQYLDRIPAAELRDAARQYAATLETPLRNRWPRHTNNRDPSRRLKVGYVSADFRRHSVAYFIEPLLAHHRRDEFDIHCYYSHPQIDPVTDRLQSLAGHWFDCHGLGDTELAAKIQADGIDILVDLGGHTAHSRLPLFAHKPAPVQVAYLGYPATTGLSAMDYRLTDTYADPPAHAERDAGVYSETLVRLPRTFLCYRPPAEAPPIAALPALRSGHVTFGSFNALLKLSPATIALWSRILKAIPDAAMLIKAAGLEHRPACDRLLGMFAQHGIAPARVTILPRDEGFVAHLERYHAVDICLDTLAYNGTTTSCEAMWMGAPVITLCGDRHASRVGTSLLHNIGLAELVAADEDDYCRIVHSLAVDLPRLSALRAGMRARLYASLLADGSGLAAAIESAYRTMWQTWCADRPPRSA